MMGYVPDPNNPGWLVLEGADAALESSWWQIPAGFVADPNNPGWYYREGSDVSQQANWVHDPSIQDATPAAAGLLRGIDVASYQPTDLSGLIAKAGARHVVVRMYQWTLEGSNLQAHSRAQVQSAQANGCSVGGYMWLYSTANAAQQVSEALTLASDIGVVLPVLWLDIEPYTDGSLPSVEQMGEAVAQAESVGQRVGIYTGKWVFDRLGNPQDFGRLPLWHAEYSGVAELQPVNYGGWTQPLGHQFSDKAPDGSPLDCDVFDVSVA